MDVALEMLRLAPEEAGLRLLADAADRPQRAANIEAVVLVNAFLFPAGVDRVLAADGTVVWENSSDPDTPIHLTTADMLDALPGRGTAVESTAGAQVRAWLDAPGAVVVGPTARHLEVLGGLLADVSTGGNLVHDAHIAALSIEHRATVVSFDRDFGRFPGVDHRVPS